MIGGDVKPWEERRSVVVRISPDARAQLRAMGRAVRLPQQDVVDVLFRHADAELLEAIRRTLAHGLVEDARAYAEWVETAAK